MRKRVVIYVMLIVSLVSLTACHSEYIPYDFDLSKYITLCEYKEVEYAGRIVSVSDADVLDAVHAQMKDKGYGTASEVTTGAVKKGDTVKVDLQGFLDGKNEGALSYADFQITIGSGDFLDGLEDGLIGAQIGATTELDVLFPDDYIKVAYAGKTIHYKITVHSVNRYSFPELSDEIAKDISDYATAEDYLNATKSELEKQAVSDEDERVHELIWSEIVDKSEVISYPERALEVLRKNCKDQFLKRAEEENQTLKEYLSDNNITESEYEAYVEAYAKRQCKDEMVMYSIARAESIEASGKEIETLAKTYAENYGYKSVKDLYKSYSKQLVKQSILYQKVEDFVVSNAVEK